MTTRNDVTAYVESEAWKCWNELRRRTGKRASAGGDIRLIERYLRRAIKKGPSIKKPKPQDETEAR